MINNEYLFGIAKLMTGTAYDIPSYLSFGSSDVEVIGTDTFIAGEFDRNALTTVTTDGAIAKYIGYRDSTEANNEYINIVGLHNSSTLYSSDNLQAEFLVSSLLHTTSFDVAIEFWIRINRV